MSDFLGDLIVLLLVVAVVGLIAAGVVRAGQAFMIVVKSRLSRLRHRQSAEVLFLPLQHPAQSPVEQGTPPTFRQTPGMFAAAANGPRQGGLCFITGEAKASCGCPDCQQQRSNRDA